MTGPFKAIGIAAGALVAVAGALAVFGVDEVPRPAWSGELKALAGNVVELDSRVTSQQLDDTKLRYFQNARERRKFPDDDLLIQEQVGLESKIDELEYRLDELRDAE